MDPIQELIARLLDEDSRTDELAALDDEQLAAARSRLAGHARAVRAGEVDGIDPNDVEHLTSVRDAVAAIKAEQGRRTTAAAEAKAEAQRQAAEADAIASEIDDEDEDEESEDDATVEAEAETIDEPEVAEPVAATVEQAPAPARRPARPPLDALIAAQPPASRPRPGEMVARPRWQLTDGTPADATDLMAIAQRMVAARESLLEAPPGFADKIPVASIKVNRPDEQTILKSDSPEAASVKLDAVTAAARGPLDDEMEALVASGGWCAPREPRYEIPDFASAARPFRDALPRLGAERGGITFLRAARLSSITTGGPSTSGAAISLWTSAIDSSPGGSVKRRQTIACRTPVDEDLDAIVMRLRFGNLQARAFPEDVAHNISLAMSAHARVAEKNLLDRLIADVNIDVTQTGVVGTARDLKHHLMQAAAQIRSVERLGDTPNIRAVLPREAVDMTVADITLQQPGDGVFGWTKDQARAFLGTSGLALSYVMDTPTGADAFVTNADTQDLADWPDNFEIPIFIDGTVVYLDNGQLDLGIVRDSTLNDTNDYEIFVETFEGLAWLGPFALTLTLTTCPNGESQVATDETGSLCSGS